MYVNTKTDFNNSKQMATIAMAKFSESAGNTSGVQSKQSKSNFDK